MEHHYILQTMIRLRGNEFLCPVGAVSIEEGLNDMLKHWHVVKYRIKKIDDDPIPEWEKVEWTPVT